MQAGQEHAQSSRTAANQARGDREHAQILDRATRTSQAQGAGGHTTVAREARLPHYHLPRAARECPPAHSRARSHAKLGAVRVASPARRAFILFLFHDARM